MTVELTPVNESDKPVLANLMQLYLHDFSEIRELSLSPHGTFAYGYLDLYFLYETREAYFISVDDELAGFALARFADDAWTVAEFFVVRRHRRRGVARVAAKRLFERHPGPWTLDYDDNNTAAAAFWHAVVPEPADIENLPGSRTRLRFLVG
ncbi:GNAT family N-acetyltransferase [Kibdelosporangium aridum]|uniref:GNAT family N-acetyltransferase n=1 Tax=Kibdelosporangium aridum TaxID=2030 RepID=UPI00068EF9C2